MNSREEQIRRVWRVLGADVTGELGVSDLWLAERIVDALALPVEVTDDMVERAAKALWAEGAARREHANYPYERLIEVTKDDLLAYARAALRAALETPS